MAFTAQLETTGPDHVDHRHGAPHGVDGVDGALVRRRHLPTGHGEAVVHMAVKPAHFKSL